MKPFSFLDVCSVCVDVKDFSERRFGTFLACVLRVFSASFNGEHTLDDAYLQC